MIRVHHKASTPKPIVNAIRSQEVSRKKRIAPAMIGARKTGAAILMYLKFELKRAVSPLENRRAANLP
jgi:hypothetical protein